MLEGKRDQGLRDCRRGRREEEDQPNTLGSERRGIGRASESMPALHNYDLIKHVQLIFTFEILKDRLMEAPPFPQTPTMPRQRLPFIETNS